MNHVSPSESIRAAIQRSVKRSALQQQSVSTFSAFALAAKSVQEILDEACRTVAHGLDVTYAKVLKFIPTGNCLLLVAGTGWSPDEIGTARLAVDDASPAGYALSNGSAVLSNHLEAELRFRTPQLLLRHGITRAINVPIRGVPIAFGVLEADSPEAADFLETDILFLEGIANIIALAVERSAAEAGDADAAQLSGSVLEASVDCVIVFGLDGRLQRINRHGRRQMPNEEETRFPGKHWSEFWPSDGDGEIERAFAKAATGLAGKFEARGPKEASKFSAGADRWWDVSVSPLLGANSRVEHVVTVARDISERRANEQRLAQLVDQQEAQLDSNDLLMKEVHHRVRNSLQLVQTLLTLQASLSQESATRAQLQAAALRVMTVGAVHRRLYEDNGEQATDAAVYLAGLVGELKGTFGDRPVRLEAQPMTLPTSRLSPLGLVTTELVINAVKYGRGAITVSFQREGADAELTVSDEGAGFPETFPSPHGSGLGMRLVQRYSGFGAAGIRVDRNVPFSRIRVKFKIH